MRRLSTAFDLSLLAASCYGARGPRARIRCGSMSTSGGTSSTSSNPLLKACNGSEQNDEPLWEAVRQSVTDFLLNNWRSGALMGSKPEEAFFARCDRSTMTQDDIDNGRLIVEIGVAPVRPAEFVIIRIDLMTACRGA